MQLTYTSILLAVLSLSPSLVSAHGKLISPLGLNVDPSVPLSSEADVALGVGAGSSACGFILGKPNGIDRSDMTPRASFAAGKSATMMYHIVNIDGAGPVNVAFSGDNGKTWTTATVQQQVPGSSGIDVKDVKQGSDAPLTITVPDMTCEAGSCLVRVNNPLTFGSCAPAEITTGGTTQFIKTYANSGGQDTAATAATTTTTTNAGKAAKAGKAGKAGAARKKAGTAGAKAAAGQ
ncbi:hypothetical protein HKX48_000612 [Thoreauomyces humboldtii]|nr:hypothetical protein HKX48_000612 [Thoreauomyces humboldtii]